MATGANASSGSTAAASLVRSPGSPVRIRRLPSLSTRIPTVTGHGLHCEARGGEELTDLRGVLNAVQRHAANNLRKQHSVVSMRAWKWPSGHLLREEAVRGLAYAVTAPVEVPEKLGLKRVAVLAGELAAMEAELAQLPRYASTTRCFLADWTRISPARAGLAAAGKPVQVPDRRRRGILRWHR
jgi:hypothetical protein